ncbi:MAG: membrane or secreted protein [Spirosomataceae bacterium]
MKKIIAFELLICLLYLAFRPAETPLRGSWKRNNADGSTTVLICADRYLMFSTYQLGGKQFVSAGGGRYEIKNNRQMDYVAEYNTTDSTVVGNNVSLDFSIKNAQLASSAGILKGTWERLDDGQSVMTGAWRIRAREGNNGEMTPMQRGSRKTIKMLSGTRFQWAAINAETKQFFGTGGGTYTIKDGKYTETLEFFSRDNSRVGMALTFDWALEGGDWKHAGKSSTGGKVNEIWAKEE